VIGQAVVRRRGYAMMPWNEVQRNFDQFTRTVKPEIQKLAARPEGA
jgi:hypothetical protein